MQFNIVLVDTPWWVGSRVAEKFPFTMACNPPGSKRRHVDTSTSDEADTHVDSWARFLVIEAADHEPIKLNPFAISKAVHGYCGEVKNVTRLRSGSLLVECMRKQQSINLLTITQFANVNVTVSAHRTLNSCRGIVRDRTRSLSDMSEAEIVSELQNQGVQSVKRFTRKDEKSNIVNTNTYLFTFDRPTIPSSIKAGYVNIRVEVYVPNPLRCYKCQKFGHGSKTCTRSIVCNRCGGNHDSTDCSLDLKCINCEGQHMAFSKSCPVYQTETQILKLKCEQNISFTDARKLVNQSRSPSTINYSAAVAKPVKTTSSVQCQTNLTWVTSLQPVETAYIANLSDSQTASPPESTSPRPPLFFRPR